MTGNVFPPTFEGLSPAQVVRLVSDFGGPRKDALSGKKEYKQPIPKDGYERVWLIDYLKTARGWKSPPHALLRMLEEYLQLPSPQPKPPTPGEIAEALKRRTHG